MCKLNLSKWMPGLWPNSWGSIRHLLPWHIVFHDAAVQHDIEWYANWWTKEDKEYFDKSFYVSMLNSIHVFKPIKRIFYMILASFYYLMVKFFWFMYFWK